jgi:predicted  nucleic acid-binding Zn-ribbon protein
MEAEKRIMEEHFERFKDEVSEKNSELEERDQEISNLNLAIKDLQQKRQNLLQKLNSGQVNTRH